MCKLVLALFLNVSKHIIFIFSMLQRGANAELTYLWHTKSWYVEAW
jgi:hypothetical protein